MKPEVVSLAVALIVTIIGILAVARQESLQRKEVKRLKSEIVSRDSTIEERERSINQWIEKYKKASKENSNLYDKAVIAEEKLMQALSERNAFKAESVHYRERMEKLEDEVGSMRNVEINFIDDAQRLRDKVAKLQNSINSHKSNYSRLRNDFKRYKANVEIEYKYDADNIQSLISQRTVDVAAIKTLVDIIDSLYEKAPIVKLYTPDLFYDIKKEYMPSEPCLSEESTEQ